MFPCHGLLDELLTSWAGDRVALPLMLPIKYFCLKHLKCHVFQVTSTSHDLSSDPYSSGADFLSVSSEGPGKCLLNILPSPVNSRKLFTYICLCSTNICWINYWTIFMLWFPIITSKRYEIYNATIWFLSNALWIRNAPIYNWFLIPITIGHVFQQL